MTIESEEKFFRAEFAKLREAKRLEAETKAKAFNEEIAIGDTLGTSDEDIIKQVRALGLDSDTARALEFLPLVAVAWADGEIQSGELVEIVRAMDARGLEADSEARHLVEALLEQRPTESYLETVFQILRAINANQGEKATSLLELCTSVASASSGLLGVLTRNKISSEEAAMIQRIEARLGESAGAKLQEVLDETSS